jgi:hypothetical protein
MTTWTPDPSDTLPSLSENDTNVKLTFSVSDDSDSGSSSSVTYTIKSINISPSRLSSFFTQSISGNTATLFANSLSGSFPILNIRYMLDGKMYNINNWDDLPSNASHITEYSKDPGSPKQITITISADGSDKSTVTNSWTYTLNGNYSSGIDKFLHELSIRK